jgi:Domain of Unknown Function with PDB structure (DUF3857)/Transglutaminase-like superfamily
MKRTFFIHLLLIFSNCLIFCGILYASNNEYSVDKISSELRSDADAVIRNHSIKFEIEDESSAVKEETLVVTIFNKDGQHYGDLTLAYDKFRSVDDLDGRILDANGEEIRELDDEDINDRSDVSIYSLYEDSRIKEAELYYNKFPYTIEYKFKISYDGYINWPLWYSRTSRNPVEYNKFEVYVPENYKLRYWCNDDSIKPEISEKGRLYSWHKENLKQLSYGAVGEDFEDVATIVKIAPTEFEIDNYKGNMETWKSFGLWVYSLFNGRNVLTEQAIKEVSSNISSSDNVIQKTLKLYKYLQSSTRYVSVQLGVGAWQPFDAKYVYEHGYGDCKALANYMVSLLKLNGITAYPVLINNGDYRMPLITEFPSNQFNHVIVCVPVDKDTMWLECTNQNAIANDIGWSNENRDALMITPKGGVIVKSPRTTSKQNLMENKIEVNLSSSSAAATGTIKWKGDQQNYVRYIVKESIPKDQEKWILKSFEVPDVGIKNYSFSVTNDSANVNLKLSLLLPKYAALSGNRIFFNPNLMNRRTYVPGEVLKRLSPIRFSYPYLDIDSIVYKIPKGYNIEAMPQEVNLTASFGNFSSKVTKSGDGNILYTRFLEIKEYEIPAENYNEYRDFFTNIAKADRSQVVLVISN